MSKPNRNPFIIFSVFQKHLSFLENTENHLDAFETLRDSGIKCKQVKGVYKHQDGTSATELSIVVSERAKVKAFQLAHRYNQESILVVGADRSAFLQFLFNGNEVPEDEHLGQWTEVPMKEAMAGGYTFNRETGAYYVCKK